MKGAVAGLILAAIGFGGPPRAAAADWSTAQTVRVATTEYKFTPNSLSFHQGMTYHLRSANKGKETHDFTAPEFFKAIQLRDAKPLNPDRTEIVIQPGRR
ncbi:MAG: cupredoxin domain-containing protein, partial [Alphaproteobacteria bacterium]|nr:cupredoxin domain-containing protein [Alphaproteobacteria bacterium]